MSSSGEYAPDDDDDVSDSFPLIPRSLRGTRSQALKDLQSVLPEESVESYGKFFHQTYHDEPSREDNFNTTQDGIVIWTPQEKRILYQVLDKKGKNCVRDIARAVGSKSELEVQEYLRLLQKGVRRLHFNERHTRTVILGDIPAAVEISEECCEVLDEHAELLCLEEQLEEDTVGEEKHGDLWIVDREVAKEVDGQSRTQDEEDENAGPSSVHSVAELFHMRKWIRLSERFFMNFGGSRLEDNWVNVAFEDESPSMTADAFADFYDLALNVTRRLVQAAHFCATSRVLKGSRSPARLVRSSDVRRAAQMLNMKRDCSEFWLGLARRCSLEVADVRHRKGWNTVHLDHDEVEALLSGEAQLPEQPYEKVTSRASSRRRSISGASDLSLSSVDDLSDNSEDEHAEFLDQRSGRLEELQCWTVLGQSPPEFLNAQPEDPGGPSRPTGKRKTMEELIDWRERTLYRSEWEEHGYESENLDSKFRENQRKRRRISTTFRPLSESATRIADATDAQSEEDISDVSQTDTEAQSAKTDSRPVTPRTSLRILRNRNNSSPPKYRIDYNFDSDIEMQMQLDTESEYAPSPRPNNSPKPRQININSQRDPNEDEENISYNSDTHLPSPPERKLSSAEDEDDDYRDDDDETEQRLFSAPLTPILDMDPDYR